MTATDNQMINDPDEFLLDISLDVEPNRTVTLTVRGIPFDEVDSVLYELGTVGFRDTLLQSVKDARDRQVAVVAAEVAADLG